MSAICQLVCMSGWTPQSTQQLLTEAACQESPLHDNMLDVMLSCYVGWPLARRVACQMAISHGYGSQNPAMMAMAFSVTMTLDVDRLSKSWCIVCMLSSLYLLNLSFEVVRQMRITEEPSHLNIYRLHLLSFGFPVCHRYMNDGTLRIRWLHN